MEINWSNLRSLNGSQNNAFEELICQLAHFEGIPDRAKSVFVRNGTPDGGVESFWTLPNDEVWGWQAKFFKTSTQFSNGISQIKESLKTALKQYPNLKKYYVCCAFNHPNSDYEKNDKGNNVQSSRTKWNNWKNKVKQSNNIDLIWWGEHEILERLRVEQHAGRGYFWFKETEFNIGWAKDRIDNAIKNAGKRYIAQENPDLNIEIDINSSFDGLGLTDNYYKILENHLNEIKKEYYRIVDYENTKRHAVTIYKNWNGETTSLIKKIAELLETKMQILKNQIDYKDIIDMIFYCKKLTNQYKDDIEHNKIKVNPFDGYIYHLNGFLNNLRELLYFISDNDLSKLSKNPFLLLTGPALIGKTHLFCDIAKYRIQNNYPTVLILGQHLNETNSPENQILGELSLHITWEEFLKALQTWGESTQKRVLVMIDALNEGEGTSFWKDRLAGFIYDFKRYPNLALALSIRDSDYDLIVPDQIKNEIVEMSHPGFGDNIDLAIRTYCNHFGITAPTFPIFDQRLNNPGFLYILCEGLKRHGIKQLPIGLKGFGWVIENYIDAVNKDIADKLNYRKEEEQVQKALRNLAGIFSDQKEKDILMIKKELTEKGIDDRIFDLLVSDGIIVNEKNEDIDSIRFSFEKFGEYFYVIGILNNLKLKKLKPCLIMQLRKILISNNIGYFRIRGIAEILAFMLPEIFNFEIIELIPKKDKRNIKYIIKDAFLNGLFWRDPKSINDNTFKLLTHFNNIEIWNLFLQLSMYENHPFNAEILHINLIKMKLIKRDQLWTSYLNRNYGDGSIINRYIQWGLNYKKINNLAMENKEVYLFGITLSWFLTSSNRELRDKSTKALVNVFQYHIYVLPQLLKTFNDVSDMYVLERIYAVSYGVALRKNNKIVIGQLAQNVYDLIFKDGKPVPHLLLRDYARGVIERALVLGCDLNIKVENIIPPYLSDWIQEPPSFECLKKQYEEMDKSAGKEEYSSSNIVSSVGEWGDFARYIIGTNGATIFPWINKKIDVDKIDYHDKYDHPFDLSLIQRWILQKIYEWGWNSKLFSFNEYFARNQSNRMGHKLERIGKKYQWLAFHEITARISDRFVFLDDSFNEKYGYKGTWQTRFRDIDPSILIPSTKNDGYGRMTKSWWSSYHIDNWNDNMDDEEWINSENDFPVIESIIKLDHNDEELLLLDGFYERRQPIPEYMREYSIIERKIQLSVNCLLIKKSKLQLIKSNCFTENGWFDEAFHNRYREEYRLFLGEYYQQPSAEDTFQYVNDWKSVDNRSTHKTEFEFIRTVTDYSWEDEYDYSKDSSISIKIPSRWLVEKMGLDWYGNEGKYYNSSGKLIGFDPSVDEMGKSSFIIDKSSFLETLEKNDICPIWLIYANKNGRSYKTAKNRHLNDSWAGEYIIKMVTTFDKIGNFKIIDSDKKFVPPRND